MVAASKQLLLLEVFQKISFEYIHLITPHRHCIFCFAAEDTTPDSRFLSGGVVVDEENSFLSLSTSRDIGLVLDLKAPT